MKEELKRTVKPIKLLIAVVSRGQGPKVSKEARRLGAHGGMVMLGRGTAPTEMLEILGIGGSEKDIFICAVYAGEAHEILTALSDKMGFSKPGGGVAFTVPVQSIAGMTLFNMIMGERLTERGEKG
ncbi:MAG: P-II family nitrogen regulator [Clostridia bacterium]|nr:P-II family nitrogen regulator [Clostridia bacterium]MBQ1375138.1 P-II family nitrogen regulator [Clostridia bacterium]MBQ1434460.1 P-II family nitrogen regulator [Clostridia bacterium]MBQ4249738.1 P-II family nitrogen regulator [Clostridia bacterium]